MMWKVKQVCHPVWQYLNQPLFDPYYASVWRPQRFWYLYKIQLLETCLKKNLASKSHYTH